MKKIVEEAKKIARQVIINEAGGIGYNIEIIPVEPVVGQIGGGNNLLSNEIRIYISPSFKLDKAAQEYLSCKNSSSETKKIISDMVRHEIGHWEYPYSSKRACPYDWFRAEEIFNGVKKGLEERKDMVGYVANLFMDIVDNTNVAYHLNKGGEGYEGQVFFYYDQGKAVNEYSPLYDWFVKIQEDMWMDEKDREFLKPFHNKKLREKIDELEDKLFEELGLKKYDYNLDVLMNKDKWEDQAEIFARIASELLLYGIPVEVLTGGENVRKETRLDRKLKDPNFLGKVIRRRWEKGKDMPVYIGNYEVLRHLYRELAKDIPIRANAYTKNFSFPVVGYGRKEIEVPTRRIGINEEGKVAFYMPKHWWEMQIPVKKSVGGIPSIYFILDNSGSMRERWGKTLPNASWSEESKYHYALLGIYGILNYLEKMQIIPPKIAVTAFSDSSRSAIGRYHDFNKIERILFSPEFGPTLIDLPEVKKVSQELGKAVIIMLSDGEIHNWDEVKNGMKEIMGRNYSAFISIQQKSFPFYDLRDVAKVFYVEKVADLSRIMIDFTKEAYGGLV